MNTPGTAWNVEPLWRALRERLPGVTIEVVARAGSTNTVLVERLRSEASTFTDSGFGRRSADLNAMLLVAEQQTSGRGRMGREWRSEAGASLTFSLAAPLARDDWSGLSLAVGVAIADALDPPRGAAAPALLLKWPNDIWLADPTGAGRKLGGILIETVATGPNRFAVIGIGINVAPLSDDSGLDAAALREIDPAATAPLVLAVLAPAPLVLAVLAPALADAVLAFDSGGFARFSGAFARRDLLRGRAVSTTDAAVPAGVAEGVDSDGALRVRGADGALALVRSGEVSVRPLGGVAGPGAAGDPGAPPAGGEGPC